MKLLRNAVLTVLVSFSVLSFAQLSADHKVSLDKGDIQSFIGNKDVKEMN